MAKMLFVVAIGGGEHVVKEEDWHLGKSCRPPSPIEFENQKFNCSRQDADGNWIYIRKEKR